MTNININVLKNFDKNKPKSIIQTSQTTQNIEKVNHKIILEVINELKEKQPFSLSSNIHSNVDYNQVSINENTVETIQCTYRVTGGFCRCCGNFTEYGLRKRRFY
jgi:hypothetical protein